MMVIKFEKNGKVIKTWEFEQLDDRLEKSIIEMNNTEYGLVRKFEFMFVVDSMKFEAENCYFERRGLIKLMW